MFRSILFTLLVAAPADIDRAPLHVYQDWIVGCDNARGCMAVGLIPANGTGFVVIEITRSGDANARPAIEMLDAPATTVAIAAGSRRLPALADKNGEIVIAAGNIAAFVPMAFEARELQLVNRTGAVVGRASLAGAMAALLYMDEQQQRVGTVTALVRRGDRPAMSVPPPPALPIARSVPGSSKPPTRFGPAQAARLRGDASCKPDAGQKDEPATFQRLDAAHTLALVPTVCVSGAYNIYSDAYILTDGHPDPEPATFGSFPGEGEDGDDTSNANVAWNSRTRTLQTGMLGRGFGDCGLWHDYVWDGRRFAPAERRQMGECRGGTDPIITWRARIVRR